MDTNEIKPQGLPWKNESYLSSYEEASELKNSLKASDKSGTIQFKIKRCGSGKTQYVVKSRIDPNLIAALEEIEQKMLTSKSKKGKVS